MSCLVRLGLSYSLPWAFLRILNTSLQLESSKTPVSGAPQQAFTELKGVMKDLLAPLLPMCMCSLPWCCEGTLCSPFPTSDIQWLPECSCSAAWLPACTDTQGYSARGAELLAFVRSTWVGLILKIFSVLLDWLGKSPCSDVEPLKCVKISDLANLTTFN